ncbi:hypothetical protein OAO01_00250 [Oligoflexia bacterium]|nr:hypothetical protein [Oligoflexia bacterium]
MPLSISNSKARAPDGSWLKIWVVGIAIALLLLGAWELFWRAQGHHPTVTDDLKLWSHHRAQVYKHGADTIVLAGSSRIQLDVDVGTLKQTFPNKHIIQLALNARGPVATFKDLALDPEFNGTVIVSALPLKLGRRFWDDQHGAAWDNQQSYVDHYRKQFRLNERLNRLVRTFLQDTLVLKTPELSLKKTLLPLVLSQQLPEPFYVRMHPDRSIAANYDMLDLHTYRVLRMKTQTDEYDNHRPHPSPAAWLNDMRTIETYVQALLGRGGKAIFVRLPTTGPLYQLDQERYPKDLYWDKWAALTKAATLHFADYKDLSAFECPDYSHLEAQDRKRFTSVLFKKFNALGAL